MSQLTLYESLAYICYRDSLSFPQFKTLCEWLGVYKYILPDNRVLIEGAFHLPIQKTSSAIYKQYLFLIILENNYSESEQINICRYIKCHSHS
jgi:hypothetical protein